HLKIGDHELLALIADRRSATKRVHASQQLGKRKRLHDIVIAADIEPLHAVVDAAERRKEKNGHRPAAAAQCAGHRKAIQTGKHAVQDDEIEVLLDAEKHAVLAVVDDIDGMAR